MKTLTRIILSICFLGPLFINVPGVKAASLHKTVLLVYPGQPDLPSTLLAEQAIQTAFSSVSDVSVDLYYEFMDFNRFPDQAYQQQLLDMFAVKYHNKTVDLVMVDGESTLNFWLAHRSEFLPDTPVVVYDVLSPGLSVRQLPADVTGVDGIVDYAPTINWILQARPTVKEVILVHGVGTVDQEFSKPLVDLQTRLAGKIKFTDWGNLTLAEIKTRASALSPSSIILFHLMFQDAAGVKYRPVDALRQLVSVSAVPILCGYDQFIGSGVIGGYMYSIEQQARLASNMGLRILRGEAVSAIPVTPSPANQFIFDHVALQKWNIPLSDLPANSTIKNRQYYIWETYQLQIIFVGSVFVLLILFILVLFFITRQLSSARTKLNKLNTSLEGQVQERTTALSQTNAQLQQEVRERTQVEETLRKYTLELERVQIQLQEQTIHDALTGAFNRRYLIETLEREIANATRNQYPLCLMIMDIDHFKTINDTYGHQAGDNVLVKLVHLLEQSTRKGDIVCRYGGEEFVVLLPHITLKDAVDRAETWRKILEETRFQFSNKQISITISIGVATNGAVGLISGDELLSHADQALLVAKKTGRNRVVANTSDGGYSSGAGR